MAGRDSGPSDTCGAPSDLLTVSFLGRYQHRPLHLFGGIGLFLTLAGLAIEVLHAYPAAQRRAHRQHRPLLFFGVLLIVVGVQIGTFGLLGQMIVQSTDGIARRPIRPWWRRSPTTSASGGACERERARLSFQPAADPRVRQWRDEPTASRRSRR